MTFKDIVTLAFKERNDERKLLAKMLKSEKKKVQIFLSQTKKITFNEVFISCSKIILVLFGLLVGLLGVYLTGNGIFSISYNNLDYNFILLVLILLVSLLATLSCLLSLRLILIKFKMQILDHLLIKNYTKKMKYQYHDLNKKILHCIECQSTLIPGMNDESMYIETEKFEDTVNELTAKMLRGLAVEDSKKYLRFYLYNNSYISNPFTQVLYVHSSTLTILSHFLHNSKELKLKDVLNIYVKSLCIYR